MFWYKEYLKTKNCIKNNGKIDFSSYKFIDPILIILLFDYITNNNVKYIKPNSDTTAEYIDFIINNYNKLNQITNSSYIPISSLTQKNLYTMTEKLENILKQKFSIENANVFNYIIGELFDNITNHSKSLTNYISAQYFKNLGFEICVYDNGIGIPGSFKNSNIDFSNDSQAIKMALNGQSTKKGNEHGFGLSSINKLLLENETESIIASGKGIYYSKSKDIKFYEADKSNSMTGTFIAIIFKNREEFNSLNLYNYTDH